MNSKHYLWVEKYRPHKISDCILPKELKDTFQGFVDKGDISNLLLVGPSGTGKTTVAMAMLDQLDCDYIIINGSLKGNIDTLRNEIQSFASSVSFKDKRKFVILDEADYLTHLTQPALRNFMEVYSENCGFILTANYRKNIIPALQSRCSVIEFVISKEELPKLAAKFLKRIQEMLKLENIDTTDATPVVAALINKFFPDWRRIINELQRYSTSGKIDEGVLVSAQSVSIKELIDLMKDKNFTKVRQWASDNIGSDYSQVYREFYDQSNEFFKTSYVPELVLTIAKYMTQASMVFDQEINFVSFCVEVMMGADWK